MRNLSASAIVPRMSHADRLNRLDQEFVWHPFTQQQGWSEEEPLQIERGEGVYLFDVDGNRYLDGTSSLWCNVHGHRHPDLDRAASSSTRSPTRPCWASPTPARPSWRRG
jgi:adenosylmethionine-8-amino-7-oxononanoate aminotransferase